MKRRTRWLIACVVAVLAGPPIVVPLFLPYSTINCRHQDVNISNGQARFSRSLWFVLISERVEDTPLSVALGSSVDPHPLAWRRVSTFGPWRRVSPHYAFHSALHQIHMFDYSAGEGDLDQNQRQKIARAVIAGWQRDNRDSGADSVIDGLYMSLND